MMLSTQESQAQEVTLQGGMLHPGVSPGDLKRKEGKETSYPSSNKGRLRKALLE
jgi:D-serine deaminase-like pyridoxal phosphate-dependent protein